MWRKAIGVILATAPLLALAQEMKHFRVAPDGHCRVVKITYTASSGTCYLQKGASSDPLSVYSTRDIDDFNHSFHHNQKEQILEVNLALEEKNSMSFSQSISSNMFTKSRPEDNIWRVELTDDIPYELELNYGIGEAYVDLSGLQIIRLSIQTGSADVNIGYMEPVPNPVPMHEMNIKVDLGNVQARQLDLANVHRINAEVGFGNMLLDLSEPLGHPCQVNASVGAGTLEILVPKDGIPVVIHIKKSMLCDVRMSRSFTETAEDTFTNTAYDSQKTGQLEFVVDVSFGTIIFKEKK
ncbi:MAG TPA: hypothetical protein ENJ39_00815 [Flammeovirgaceae bacterium]|nr:hypothetical protein [Flammeovirgaceae bacterium]